MHVRAFLSHLLLLAFGSTAFAAPVPLHDGKTFAGWEGETNRTWRIEDGAFAAGDLAVNQPRNEFLATRREYENFDLTLKWKLQGTEGFVNGGVQFRTKRIPNHHEVSGYQADLGAGYDGALYDESRRNKMLAKPSPEVLAKARKPLGEWNDYRIRAEGPRLQIWLNGVQTVDFTETDPAIPRTGIIAVQIHGNAKAVVHYKELMIKELPATPPPPAAPPAPAAPSGAGLPLFDGKTLAGWGGPAAAHWRVEEGNLVYSGAGQGQGADHWLATTRTFANFEVRFSARTEGQMGTGLFFRSDATPGRRIVGWQCDVGQNYDGGLYKEGPGGGMIAYPAAERIKRAVKPGEWNEYRVRAEGRRLLTWVNGEPMVDHTETGPTWRRDGVMALEVSAHSTGTIRYKDIRVWELPPTPAEPVPAAPAEGPARRMTDTIPAFQPQTPFAGGKFGLNPGDTVVFTGSENMVLEQGHGALEARLTAQWKEAAPRFRHLGWEGDTVYRQNRMMEWGSWEENLAAVGATVVVAWFGQVEVLDDTRGAAEFAAAYGKLLDEFARRTPRVVIVGPPPFEKPADPRVPDNTPRNARLREFNDAARRLASERGFVFVDLVAPLSEPRTGGPYTRDGLHFAGTGLDLVGEIIATALGATSSAGESLRQAVVRKNRLWFDTWRCMNWAFAYGDRDTQPFAKGADGRPPFVEELKQYQPLLRHAEESVLALATGRAPPAPLPPAPPRADPPALSPEEQMARFKLREGFAVNLFADETKGVVRPLQIRWDERGRLWVACTPAYPQLQPGEHGNDYILVLEDTDGDGHADTSERFAEGLTMPMGFEFASAEAGGGLYVCESTQLIHLPDTNADGKADGRAVILSGFGTGDTHQDANSLRWGPDGCLWFTQGYHIWSYVETPYGLSELNRSGIWRFNPRTLRLGSFLNESTAGLNCWGTAWDDYGQVFHGSGADTLIWHTTPALIPTLHPLALPTGMAASRGKSMEPEIMGSRHLPDDLRGVLLKSTYFTSQIQLYRLRDQGSGFASEDMGDLMSGQNEFRPVETRVGPDGAIYVCDWLNPVIGHYQASYRDPRRDRSHGRIWRITAQGRSLTPKPALAGKSARDLIPSLISSERWERDTAKHALYRRSAAEVLPAARAALESATGEQKLRLAYELSGVFAAHESPNPGLIDILWQSDDFRYRAWAVRLVGVWAERLENPVARLAAAVADQHPRVRLEAVVAAAWMPAAHAVEALKTATLVLEKPLDAPLQYALTQCIHALEKHWRPALAGGQLDFGPRIHALARVLTTVGDNRLTGQVRELLAAGKITGPAREGLLAVLIENGSQEDAEFAIAQAPDSQAVMDALVSVAWRKRDVGYGAVMDQLINSPHRAARIAGCRMVASTGKDFGTAGRISVLIANAAADPRERVAAMAAVAKLKGKAALPELLALADAPDPTLRAGAVEAAASLDTAAVADRVAAYLAKATQPSEVEPLLLPMLTHRGGPAALVRALGANPPPAAVARLAVQWMASTGRDEPSVREALQKAAGIQPALPAYSPEEVKRLVSEAMAKGDARRGETVFNSASSTCLACHKLGAEGGVLGPDLSAIGRSMMPEAVVESVYWPKRQVKEGYLLTQVTTKDGRNFQGYKAAEDKTSLTLRGLNGAALPPLAKADIATRLDTGTLMPDGLIAPLGEQERLDLLRFLFGVGR